MYDLNVYELLMVWSCASKQVLGAELLVYITCVHDLYLQVSALFTEKENKDLQINDEELPV